MLRSFNSNIKFYFLLFNFSKTQLSRVSCFPTLQILHSEEKFRYLIFKKAEQAQLQIRPAFSMWKGSPIGNSFEVPEIMMSEKKDQFDSSPSLIVVCV